jgi:hypothetical protein
MTLSFMGVWSMNLSSMRARRVPGMREVREIGGLKGGGDSGVEKGRTWLQLNSCKGRWPVCR